jgi:hypothetical protein
MSLSHDASEEINFWPAYVDALINVVLNLLFLVGVFTIGLVSLNEQALFAEQEANKRKLASLESARSVQERMQIADEILRSLPPAPTVLKVEQPQIHEIFFKSESRLKAAAEVEQTKPNQSTSVATFEQFKRELSNDGDLSRITFEPNQYNQPPDWAWLEEVKTRASQKTWFLYVIADPANQRLSREAYARLVFVRSALLQAGALAEQIQMKVTPAAEVSSLPPGIERTVWVIERSR